MEVGVAWGRFSEHFLIDNQNLTQWEWTMVEPFPHPELVERYNPDDSSGKWNSSGLLGGVRHNFFKLMSLDEKLLSAIPEESYDFIYLDGDHSYEGVKAELYKFWPKVSKGGMLAGHDYCSFGEKTLQCNGCDKVPPCTSYTEYGKSKGKKNNKNGVSVNQYPVVNAVQEWLVEMNDPSLQVRFTNEDFSRDSLSSDGMDYDLIITNTRTPSWYFIKPDGPEETPQRSMLDTLQASASKLLQTTQNQKWTEEDIVRYMTDHPNRAYFSRLFKEGGFRTGMEVGVADGRFSEHFLIDFQNLTGCEWTMVEPFPNSKLVGRYNPEDSHGKWKSSGLLNGVKHNFFKLMSLDENLLSAIPDESYDFIYLDGDHSYKGVKAELYKFWPKVKSGGMLAGHDYCSHWKKTKNCTGCEKVPRCKPYSEYGVAHGKKNNKKGMSVNQWPVVKAVQEWLIEMNDSRLKVRYTNEDFTRESLRKDGMDYDLIITNTRTPSWYFIKP